jgi:oxygen-independent coproporphyrinogen-3 oxidase
VSERRIRTADGVELALHRLRAYRDERPGVLLVHGAFSGHRVWLRRKFAYFLGERGLDVWAVDLRHHGTSEREPVPRTWRFEDWILRDASAVVQRIKDETNDAPLAWVGHSAGGAVGLCAAARLPGLVAVQAIVTLGTPGPRRMGPLRWGGAALMIALARALGRFPARATGVGAEDEAAELLADWLAWNVRGRWVGRDGYDYWHALRTLRAPYLAVAGERDRWFAPPAACAQVVEQVGAENKTLSVQPQLGHRGLVLSGRARAHAWPAVAEWLADALSAQ